MGGLVAVVDWERPVAAREIDPMLAHIPHQAAGGVGRIAFDHAALGETRSLRGATDNPTVATAGHLSIVGDLRLWNRDGLRGRSGGHAVTAGMSDRRLLLEAYHRTGIEFLDDVDGDFAFVIWNNHDRTVLAVRDRFGTKPLFYERTPTGIRFATEPKQLVATSARPVRPCVRSVAEYLTDHYTETRFSFFEGIERIRPSTALVESAEARRELCYWNPGPDSVRPASDADVAGGLRERLAEAVSLRTATTDTTLAHLSGGLDSSSITAAAHLLDQRGALPSAMHTVSAVFPDYPGDESAWIDDIAKRQPFPHHEFAPDVASIEQFDTDMWIADRPWIHRIRGMWTETASIGTAVGADLVLTGRGGDEILDQDQLVADRLLRSGSVSRRIRDARAISTGSGGRLPFILTDAARDVVPTVIKGPLRRLVPNRGATADSLATTETLRSLAVEVPGATLMDVSFPSLLQNNVIAGTQHPTISWTSEVQSAEYGSRGIDVSHPYLDRSVAEYVASIRVADRPLDGRTKALVRHGFSDLLPESVLTRRVKSTATEYLGLLFKRQGDEYRSRYPAVTDDALEYVDQDRYGSMLKASSSDQPDYRARNSLWTAWTLMAWLDGLHRYQGDSMPSGQGRLT